MKKALVVAMFAWLLSFTGIAQAVPLTAIPFTVDSIAFTNVIGNAENFTWSVTAVAGPINFNIDVGQSQTFTYGIFSTTDFSLDSSDRNDYDDSFRANFSVQPPSPPSGQSQIGSPDATADWFILWYSNERVTVDFNNNPILVNFGTGGQYSVTFLDPATLYANGSTDLQARITLISDSQAVPEPTTMLLLGLGLVGLAGFRRKK